MWRFSMSEVLFSATVVGTQFTWEKRSVPRLLFLLESDPDGHSQASWPWGPGWQTRHRCRQRRKHSKASPRLSLRDLVPSVFREDGDELPSVSVENWCVCWTERGPAANAWGAGRGGGGGGGVWNARLRQKRHRKPRSRRRTRRKLGLSIR